MTFHLGNNLNALSDKQWREIQTNNINILYARIEVLENALKARTPVVEKINNDNEAAKAALMDADNAIQKVIAHFKRTSTEHKADDIQQWDYAAYLKKFLD